MRNGRDRRIAGKAGAAAVAPTPTPIAARASRRLILIVVSFAVCSSLFGRPARRPYTGAGDVPVCDPRHSRRSAPLAAADAATSTTSAPEPTNIAVTWASATRPATA